jgi:release factor glutamine methyltransferase
MQRIIDIISLSADYLKHHGVPQPRLNAELLLSHLLGKSRLDLYLEYDHLLAENELSSLRTLLKARASHKPLQYLLGRTDFFSLPFLITEGVFIPRPETEILVEEVIHSIRSSCGSKEIIVYDVGTGSGCIAISVAHNLPSCLIHASDISAEALAVAKQNAEKNGVGNRVTFLRGDMFEPFSQYGAPKADVIVSNPPYIAEEDWNSLPDEVKHFEPPQSLLSGKEGLDFLRKLITCAESYLKPGGRIFLEIGEAQRDAVVALLESRKKYVDIGSRKDYNERDRVVFAKLSPIG